VRVAGPDTARLVRELSTSGARVTADGGGAIIVRDRSIEQVGQAIAARGLVVTELAPVGSSLEEIYLELTGNENGGPS
jgi:ABC-2 type transport system ATP-binding protein